MAGRPRTVLSPPKPERVAKPKAQAEPHEWAPRAGQPTWRVRDLDDTNPQTANVYLLDRDAAEALADDRHVLETLTRACWAPLDRDVPRVADLAADGGAREVSYTTRGEDGREKSQTRWVIDELAQQAITDAMVGRDE